MGLDINAVRFLIDARNQGVPLGEVLTIGRQHLNVYPAKMARVLEGQGLPPGAFRDGDPGHFADPCFLSLGARQVHALDFSDFEGAKFVHDLNRPIGAEFKERFDTVYDGGTLEHIFNFPMALQNCMEMVKPGGQLFIHTAANNWCGHGFYQFSPELFFRALSRENGFVVERMIVHAVGPYGRWYEVKDPEEIRSRVEVLTFYPLQMLVRAKRVAAVPVFTQPPQQSDYTPRWQEPAAAGKPGEAAPLAKRYTPVRPRLARFFPGVARLLHVLKIGFQVYTTMSLWNRRCFRPVKKP